MLRHTCNIFNGTFIPSIWRVGQRTFCSQYSSSRLKNDCPASSVKTIDLRSDVLSKPTEAMMRVMIESACYGDDVFGENTTVNALESRVAKLLGKEAGLFVTSGSMGNLLSLMAHCRTLGSEAILGDKCHIHVYEQGSLASIARAHHRTAATQPDGTLCLDECRRLVRPPLGDAHYPVTRVLCLENTHNATGGRVLPVTYFAAAREFCDSHGIRLHLDGARLLNAAMAANVEPIEFGKYVDSVTICFSKGLGAPVGSCIAADAETISFCRRLRKALGGSARQPGLLAAAAGHSLDVAAQTLAADHANAQFVYSGFTRLNPPSWLLFNRPETNIMMLGLARDAPITIGELQRLLEEPNPECSTVLRAPAVSPSSIRMVMHNCVTRADCELVVGKLASALKLMKQ